MGIMNLRAICPNCGGKIHTQPKGIGHLTWARSWFLVKTGTTCQNCGVALTGRVKVDNRAELATPKQAVTHRPDPATTPHTPKPGPQDPWLNQVADKARALGIHEIDRNYAGTQVEGIPILGSVALEGNGHVFELQVFATSALAAQAVEKNRSTPLPDVRTNLDSGAATIEQVGQLMLFATSLDGPCDIGEFNKVAELIDTMPAPEVPDDQETPAVDEIEATIPGAGRWLDQLSAEAVELGLHVNERKTGNLVLGENGGVYYILTVFATSDLASHAKGVTERQGVNWIKLEQIGQVLISAHTYSDESHSGPDKFNDLTSMIQNMPAPDGAGQEVTPADDDHMDALRKLGDLHQSGVLTDDEFKAKKEEILRRI
jgi:hypothetical protein